MWSDGEQFACANGIHALAAKTVLAKEGGSIAIVANESYACFATTVLSEWGPEGEAKRSRKIPAVKVNPWCAIGVGAFATIIAH